MARLGRDGKCQPGFDRQHHPRGADRRAAQRLDRGRAGIPLVQLRGVERVKAEWTLVCMVLNLRGMSALSRA
jgi:hypothetical protein